MTSAVAPAKHPIALSRFARSDLPAWSRWLLLGAIGIGAALRLYQFAADSSLWLDELAIVNNLAERSLWSLLREPLDYAQVAPPGFIIFEKAIYEIFGPNDHALRLYSLLTGVGALGAITLVAVRIGLRETAWVAPLLLGLGQPFIFQSAQVKPYAGDVFFSLALVAVALRLHADAKASRVWPTLFGLLAPWFSFAACLTLAGIGVVLLLHPQRRRYVPVVAAWGMMTLLALAFANTLLDRTTAANMHAFWSRDGVGFPPTLVGVVSWWLAQLRSHLWSEVGLRGVTYWLGIAGVGAVVLWLRQRFALAILATPILVALVAAAARKYPLGSRLSQWIAAFLILFVVAAAHEAVRVLRRRRLGVLAPAPGMIVAALPVLSFVGSPPPYRVENVKPVLAEIRRLQQPNDWLYIHPGAWHAFRYYGALSGIPHHRVVYGLCPRESPREALAPFDAIGEDRRVWVLFAHVAAPNERELVLRYLDRIGQRRKTVSVPDPYVAASSSVDAHLYELRDPAARQRSAWQTYPLADDDVPNAPSICTIGMVNPRPSRPQVERAGDVARPLDPKRVP